ncbi:hypothetical protein TSAR_013282 [Trichomalopsis sarcophagae]|uniref:Endonuclease/exonuclease/phosphatase domain-containing protein n=1 Tax=Trichomalopsis sarcophagae TaxID=543379 RepID=A0A232EIN2_9HYME|nr:hypothetical protein TSAR_013282 [Trichomalopsis sarcophagae]
MGVTGSEKGIYKGERLVLVGDFNARVGEQQGDGDKCENKMKSRDKLRQRRKETIMGGRRRDNFREEMGSVLDLVMEIETEKGSIIKEIEIIKRIESDHLPTAFSIKKGEREDRTARERKEGEK